MPQTTGELKLLQGSVSWNCEKNFLKLRKLTEFSRNLS